MLDFISFATFLLIIISTTLLLLLSIHHFQKPPHVRRRLSLPPSPFALPIVGHLHLLSPFLHRSLHNLSSLYGPLFHLRLGSVPCFVVSTPELAKKFLMTHELNFSSRKHSIAIDRLTYDSAFAFAPYGPYWKFLNKLCMSDLLGNRSINHSLPVRTRELNAFLQLVMKKANDCEAVNLTKELSKYTNTIISQMMIGVTGEAEEARTLAREVTQIFGEFNVSDFIWVFKNLDLQGIRKRVEDIHSRYDALLERIITNREHERKSPSLGDRHAKNFLDILLDVSEDDNLNIKCTRDQIKGLILDFFTAATDTSAIALEWALAELINNPRVLQKAQEEIDNVVGKHRLVSESDGPNLPYIQAIIKETLRLHPPLPMIIRKSVQDCMVYGYNIPANSVLFVNIWSIARNPEYWESPLDFKPERFLRPENGGPVGLIDVKGQHFQLLPFGTGRRGCPGSSLAMQELPAVLGGMIQCFEWKAVNQSGVKMNGDGVVDMTEQPGMTAPRAHDLVCMPIARINQLYTLLNR
ncbi:licodione synthase-like [Camellia sinensis]|uniref:Flavone synthase II n=1 Tax=Camellia sinensis var. sinensis TaxID=542762 RepID=A0A4S4DUS5_CAMSN|nr:licodione synthase-like [Camellia sinensis]THG07040.1 hypothetical protein TEA_019294 [Camellia sinensis var. sinensis]